jgi:prophage regulatory protein
MSGQPEKLLRLPQVLSIIPISRSSWWKGVKSGLYPPAVRLGKRTTAWRESDVLRLCERGVLEVGDGN